MCTIWVWSDFVNSNELLNFVGSMTPIGSVQCYSSDEFYMFRCNQTNLPDSTDSMELMKLMGPLTIYEYVEASWSSWMPWSPQVSTMPTNLKSLLEVSFADHLGFLRFSGDVRNHHCDLLRRIVCSPAGLRALWGCFHGCALETLVHGLARAAASAQSPTCPFLAVCLSA